MWFFCRVFMCSSGEFCKIVKQISKMYDKKMGKVCNFAQRYKQLNKNLYVRKFRLQ